MPDDGNGAGSGGGGFIVEDDAPGGFLPDDDDESGELDHASSSRNAGIVKPSTLPLSAIPEALANLGLDSADASVLSLFAETAYTPSSSRRRLPPGVKQEKVVGRQEFQQVASILVEEQRSSAQGREDDANEEGSSAGRRRPKRQAAVQGRQKAAEIIDEETDGGRGGGFIVDDGDNSEDDFEASRQRRRRGNKASLDTGSDLTSEDEYNVDDAAGRDSSTRRRRRGGSATSPSPSPSFDDDDDDGEAEQPAKRRRSRKDPGSAPTIRSTSHLNPLQRSNASTLFELLLARLPASNFPLEQRRIGVAELTAIIQSIGEKIPPKEIEEMVEEASKLFAPASAPADQDTSATPTRKSASAIKGAAAAQGIVGSSSVGLDEFAGVLVHNRLI